MSYDPASGGVLRVENQQIVYRSGPDVAKCQKWCGYYHSRPAVVPMTPAERVGICGLLAAI
jgi:hypothetical protein